MKQISTIDIESIRKHPSNNSPSKVAYQFSKSKRFPDLNPEYLFHLFIDVPMHFILLTASFRIEKQALGMEKNMILHKSLVLAHLLQNMSQNPF